MRYVMFFCRMIVLIMVVGLILLYLSVIPIATFSKLWIVAWGSTVIVSVWYYFVRPVISSWRQARGNKNSKGMHRVRKG